MMHHPAKKQQETRYIGSKFGLSLNLSRWRYSTMNNLQYLVPFSPRGSCFRSNYQGCSVKKDVLRNFAIFAGKYLCQGLYFNKVADACNVIKKETLTQVFSCEFCEISKNTFFTKHFWAAASDSLTIEKTVPKF